MKRVAVVVVIVLFVVFPGIGSSINFISRMTERNDRVTGEEDMKCEELYLPSLHVEKCRDEIIMSDTSKMNSSFRINFDKEKIYNFLQYCFDFEAEYTIKFHYFPDITFVKNEMGFKSFYIKDVSVSEKDLLTLYYFIK